MGISCATSAPSLPVATQVGAASAPKSAATTAPVKPPAPAATGGTDGDGDHDGSGVGGKVNVLA